MDPDLTKALEEARRTYTIDEWLSLRPRDRVDAIYRALRRIDMEHTQRRQREQPKPNAQPIDIDREDTT